MKLQDFQKLIQEIENKQCELDKYLPGIFNDVFDDENLTEAQRQCIDAEFWLFRLNVHYSLTNAKEHRFTSDILNGKAYPGISYVTDRGRLEYYRKRATDCKNPRMCARYLDINYEYNSNIQRNDLAPELVQSYIEASGVEWAGYSEKVDYLARSFLVAHRHKGNHSQAYKSAKSNILNSLDLMSGDKDNYGLRWCIDVIRVVIRYKDEFDSLNFEAIKKIIESGLEYYMEMDNFNLVESFTKLKHELIKIVSPHKDNKASEAKDLAQLYINLAKDEGEKPIARQHLLQTAAEFYKKAGLTREAKAVFEQAEGLGKLPEFSSQFQEMQIQTRTPQALIDRQVEDFVGSKDKADIIARYFLPSHEQSRLAEPESAFDMVATTIHYDKENTAVAKGSDSPEKRAVENHYQNAVLGAVLSLDITLTSVLAKKKFLYEDIKPQVQKIRHLDKNTYESVKLGFSYFFENKYFESVCILVPQLEALLGYLLELGGGSKRYQKDDRVQGYKTLGTTLGDLKEHLGQNCYHYCKYQLIDPAGSEDIRNITAHGRLKANDQNIRQKAIIVLQIYMMILVRVKKLD